MESFSVQKGGPPKIGGPVRPNSSNMPKAGPGTTVDGSESFVFSEQRVTSWTFVMSVFEAVDVEW